MAQANRLRRFACASTAFGAPIEVAFVWAESMKRLETLRIKRVKRLDEIKQLAQIDGSFTTDRIYQLSQDDFSFNLIEEVAVPPTRKAYPPLTQEISQLEEMDYMLVAESGGNLVGFAAAKFEAWNRRVVILHLYISPEARRHGIGRALVESLVLFAGEVKARCLWLETQNINYPAIQFYRRLGFRLCGLDTTLYDPQGTLAGEVALFFTKALQG